MTDVVSGAHQGAQPTQVSMLPLPDGRDLEIAVSGPADGVPFVWHHGTPGCVHQAARMRAATAERGLRLVTYSRAGAGRSTRHPGRTVADVAADVAAVLDHLGADRCLTGGGSGGGPHALATGALLPERVAGVLCVCGIRPYRGDLGEWLAGMGQDNLDEFGLALEGEEALRPYLVKHRAAMLDATVDEVIEELSTLLPPVDRAVLTGDLGADLLAGLQGGVRSVDGWLDDDLAFTTGWGFELEALREHGVPTYLWQGSADLMVPAAHAQWLSEHLPDAVLHLEEGEGHLSVSVGALPRMLDELVTHL
ncbi:MAG: Hydrolase, alpha/beta fold family [uncultured Nocardioidaceae bacterium]|uniref:Hydrolase, alpha/beta fold family n=1 Tax=uncultured Nocardioidaceae bacterium TaxID=253824 RepID=A0A6J4L5Y9_9ACTN|nr:MAG: Hydrolase, alpha/beta fold family [uncultured Nocardioidaceae bacterium]